MKRLTPGQRWWYGRIEQRAYARLHALQRAREGGLPPLWDGRPPVPVEHVAEHLLGLSIVCEEVEEEDGEEILGCLRPEAREIVLNERHLDRFRDVPGSERHTIGHECGHADVFGDADRAAHELLFPGLDAEAHTQRRAARRGGVRVLRSSMTAGMRSQLDACTPAERAEVMRRWHESAAGRQRDEAARGGDTQIVRRAVDHYAATLLMPADLLREAAAPLDLSRWSSIAALADLFQVSKQSVRIQLEALGLIHGVDGTTNRILLADPAGLSQLTLL